MANRTFIDKSYAMVKREVRLYAAVLVGELGAITLRKWNYPTLGSAASPARTYTAAPTTPSGNGFPIQYQTGAEGVRSVTRTATGLWTVKLQDNYQRVLRVDSQMQIAGGLSNIVAVGINSTTTSIDASGGSEVGIALLSATGTAADPTSGALVLLTLTLADATEP